jgi:DNA-binding MarR family transcriptional regulator
MPRLDAERVALWRTFRTAGDLIARRIEQELAWEFGLTLPQFELLTVLAKSSRPLRVRDLAEQLSAVPSSLSRRIDALISRGYVERVEAPTPDDARAVEVHLTRDGRLVWRDANVAYRRAVQREFAAHLTDSDLVALWRVLGKVPPSDA